MRVNTKTKTNERTHGGGIAASINPEQALRRSVMSCMLWENEFYEGGQSISERIIELCKQVEPDKVAVIALAARTEMHLRHVPLLLARELARNNYSRVDMVLDGVIQRADELAEFLALYWQDGKCPVSHKVRNGLNMALTKFNEYALAKYNRKSKVKLRDVLRVCHPTPKCAEQGQLWKDVINDTLTVPDTWETALSAGGDKGDTWNRLVQEQKLGGLAFLRNLRNMREAGLPKSLIKEAIQNVNFNKVFPYRFIAANTYNPEWEDIIEPVMLGRMAQMPKLSGKTVLIVDVSGSMYGSGMSNYSEMDRAKTACSLAILVRELCEDSAIYATAGNDSDRIHQTKLVPSRRGFALADKVYTMCQPLGGGGIFLKQVMDYVFDREHTADRIIVITDEQDCSRSSADSPNKANAFGNQNYIINVASAKNGIAYDKWTHINGFSESVLRYIAEYERIDN